MGLINLKYIDQIYESRKVISERYDQNLKNLKVTAPLWFTNASLNYAYYPLIFESKELLIKLHGIFKTV
jgi:dTDP-4-amino-4,6-dideoxygalactose transaminase